MPRDRLLAHQHKALETACPDVALHRLARHREARGPEPLAQLVGIDEGTVDQFARRVKDARDGDFPALAHRRQATIPPQGMGRRIPVCSAGDLRYGARSSRSGLLPGSGGGLQLGTVYPGGAGPHDPAKPASTSRCK